MDVKDGVMEVCVRIGPGTSAQEALTAFTAQECHVLNKVSNTLTQ